MKFLLLILFFGLALSEVHDDREDYYEGFENFAENKTDHDDPKTTLGKILEESLNRVLGEIKDVLSRGKNVSHHVLNQGREILKKLKELGIQLEDKTKDLLHDVKDRVKSWWKDVLNQLLVHKDKNETQYAEKPLDFYEMIENIKKFIEEIKQYED